MTNDSRDLPYDWPYLWTAADVTTMWRTLMNPLGWHTRRLYLILAGSDRRAIPQIVEVDEIPDELTRADAEIVVGLLSDLLGGGGPEEGGSAAILLARPGGELLTDADRQVCRDLYAAASDAGVRLELLHVGTNTAIVPAPMDEVLPRSA